MENVIDKSKLHRTTEGASEQCFCISVEHCHDISCSLVVAHKEKNRISDTVIRKCRECGCTDNDCSQCIAATGEPCHWVEPDLCSRCKDELDTGAAFAADDFRIPGAEAARHLDLTRLDDPEAAR